MATTLESWDTMTQLQHTRRRTITVGAARKPFSEAMQAKALERTTGYGLDESTQMGPVITPESRARVETLIGQAVRDDRARDGGGSVGGDRGHGVEVDDVVAAFGLAPPRCWASQAW